MKLLTQFTVKPEDILASNDAPWTELTLSKEHDLSELIEKITNSTKPFRIDCFLPIAADKLAVVVNHLLARKHPVHLHIQAREKCEHNYINNNLISFCFSISKIVTSLSVKADKYLTTSNIEPVLNAFTNINYLCIDAPRKTTLNFPNGIQYKKLQKAKFNGVILNSNNSIPISSITDLTCSKTDFKDFAFLSILCNLHSFHIAACDIHSLQGIQNTLISKLWISECALNDVSPIFKIEKLEELRLAKISKLTVLPHIVWSSSIKYLSLIQINDIVDLTALEKQQSIQEIFLDNLPKIKPKALEFLKEHKSLKRITFDLLSKSKSHQLRKLLPTHIIICGA